MLLVLFYVCVCAVLRCGYARHHRKCCSYFLHHHGRVVTTSVREQVSVGFFWPFCMHCVESGNFGRGRGVPLHLQNEIVAGSVPAYLSGLWSASELVHISRIEMKTTRSLCVTSLAVLSRLLVVLVAGAFVDGLVRMHASSLLLFRP